jgi:hypothetical protein
LTSSIFESKKNKNKNKKTQPNKQQNPLASSSERKKAIYLEDILRRISAGDGGGETFAFFLYLHS